MAVNPLPSPADILAVVRRYWGYDTLRPLQEAAMQAALTQRDARS